MIMLPSVEEILIRRQHSLELEIDYCETMLSKHKEKELIDEYKKRILKLKASLSLTLESINNPVLPSPEKKRRRFWF